MCGIAGIYRLTDEKYTDVRRHLAVMNRIQAHRGPDDEGTWIHPRERGGFAHRRLSIIDLATGAQPMTGSCGNTICYNGEIYNYIELRQELAGYDFRTTSDTEVILAAYRKWGVDCVQRLRGMFAFALWDDSKKTLFCARDRFGIKPFCYATVGDVFYFASEAKALLPFLPAVETDPVSLKEYLVFQFCLEGRTLFKGVRELPPAHRITIRDGAPSIERYWEIYYSLDFDHTPRYFEERLRHLVEDSIRVHVRSDVPVGAYVSGGIDSSVVASVGSRLHAEPDWKAFHGKFSHGAAYDESPYARALAEMKGLSLHEVEIGSGDFVDSIRKVIYHLDYPVAGPGSFPQYHVSRLAAKHRKVVLGGQGGDEVFGGYVRYLIAYFEQCIKGAIEGTLHSGNFIVTYESIIPNLVMLRNYKPLLQEFWREGIFEDLDRRYFRLINRASTLENEIRWREIGDYSPFEAFRAIFNGRNVGKESYLDKMMNFDFKTLLPALLQVEDRMSMAHGLESRVPLLDHPLVEFTATMPSNIKFKDGTLKMVFVNAMRNELPEAILNRKDKMGFPVPLNDWLKKELKEFVNDIFRSRKAKERPCFNSEEILKGISRESQFGRKVWGLLSLELWHQEFQDRQHDFRRLLTDGGGEE
ncbi:MAG: asparagine synthase (glutamine-hydrolyzing) [Deltaproteobacteria bacterium]|nr:asparagine synthase (glutamine-hydrolyzing) [Deltaproteobacteria bacterium]